MHSTSNETADQLLLMIESTSSANQSYRAVSPYYWYILLCPLNNGSHMDFFTLNGYSSENAIF